MVSLFVNIQMANTLGKFFNALSAAYLSKDSDQIDGIMKGLAVDLAYLGNGEVSGIVAYIISMWDSGVITVDDLGAIEKVSRTLDE